ncbi:Transcription initiation factor TFIID subunit 7 [Yarrowia sp. B02]|nr:Transcription initiation factor TFIID subunit 7 [Yarrowia sp. B02]
MIKIKLKPEKRSPESSPEKRKSKKRRTDEDSPRPSTPSLSIKLKAPKKEKESKPRLSLKLTSKKGSESVGERSASTTSSGSTKKKVVPRIRVKAAREPGQGYDSEAPDREDDPLIEEGLILRFPPVSKKGRDDLAYLRTAVENQDYSNVVIRFKDSRRAVVSIRGRHYAAKLVDLPAIVEAQKTFDRGKNMFKCLDICQMLLVTEPISSEHHIMEAKSMQWDKASSEGALTCRNGLTPPLFDAKRRRFRKTVSTKVIESVEQKVTDLLDLDDEADSTSYELVDGRTLASLYASGGGSVAGASASVSQTVSAAATPPPRFAMVDEGEMDVDLLDKELERALEDQASEEGEEIEADDASESEDEGEGGAESDNSDEEEEVPRASAGMDDDDDGEEGGHAKVLVDTIADLEATIKKQQDDADRTANAMLKERFLQRISKLKHELEVKKKQLKAKNTIKEKKKENDKKEGEKKKEAQQAQAEEADVKKVDKKEVVSEDDDDMNLDDLF